MLSRAAGDTMLDVDGRLDAADIDRLAALHSTTMTSSVLGRMGVGLLARYYRWLVASPHEWLAVARGDAGLVGAAVLSFDPARVLQRFASHAPLAFAAAVGASLLRDRTLRQETCAYLRERMAGDRETPAAPELLQIFVDAAQQDRSVGSGLLQHVEAYLRTRNVDCYYARTLAADNARALGFYERRGFRRVRELHFCGSRYVLMNRTVRGEPR